MTVALPSLGSLALKEHTVATATLRKWEKKFELLHGHWPTADNETDDPAHAALLEGLRTALDRLKFIRRRRKRAEEKVAAASAALTEAAAAVDASLPIVEAAEAVRRAAALKEEEEDEHNVHGSVGRAVGARRLWTADVREEVLAHDDWYQELVLEYCTSREMQDAVAELSQAQIRRLLVVFRMADIVLAEESTLHRPVVNF